MPKRTVFTTISPLPPGISRELVLDFLHNHEEMIDLNPLIMERHPIDPPADCPPEERHCIWYSLTDKIAYLPGGLATGDVSYTCAFHDLPDGIQTHCRAPLGVDIRDKWTLNGTLPGEPVQPVELGIGAPLTGLYIREDVDLRCNILTTAFVKKNLKKSHATLVEHLVAKAKRMTAAGAGSGSSHAHGRQHSRVSAGAAAPRPWVPVGSGGVQPTGLGVHPAAPHAAVSSHHTGGRDGRTGTPPGYPPPAYGSSTAQYPSSGGGADTSAPSEKYRAVARHQPHLLSYAAHRSAQPSPQPPAVPPYDLPVASSSDPALYPDPLRLRSASSGSTTLTANSYREDGGLSGPGGANVNDARPRHGHQQHHSYHYQVPPQHQQQHQQPRGGRGGTGGQQQEHPDYPQMNPYRLDVDLGPPLEKPAVVLAELPNEKDSRRQQQQQQQVRYFAELE
ncbi:Nacht and wd40 domain protein [Pleurostoma richardsiae]|uniref:Nacht and wd40 domain protein n=1 Tax=Pleurostoma richardsiae TaxID=41990 RepID=A0AA38R8F8_9PEZI|nr:Nacht and wd40 domain protein [Pleurostoma richardsiae]